MIQHGHFNWRDTKRPLAIALLLFFIIDISILPVVGPIIPDPGPSVSPGNICCNGCGSLSIPVKNIKDTVFNGRIEIKITDPNGNIISQDSISITLAPGESRVINTPICPPCSSLRGESGSYRITATVIEDTGKIHDSKNAFFIVKKCPTPPQCTPGPTETYQCADNKVKRLYKNADCTEHWETIKDCNQCSDPPCKCAVGSCIHVDGPSGDGDGKVCNQIACQSQNGPFSTPYSKYDKMFQRYKECTCVDGNCDCKSVEKEVPCTGTISGHVYDAKTKSPLPGAKLLICQDSGNCLPMIYVDSAGIYSTNMQICPSRKYEITCSAEGYKQAKKAISTNEKGNYWEDFPLDLEGKPDLEIVDLKPSKENPVAGEPIKLTATIKNIGSEDITVGMVTFLQESHFGKNFMTYYIANIEPNSKLSQGQSVDIPTTWTAAPIFNDENKEISVTAYGNKLESDMKNNYKILNINVNRNIKPCNFDIAKDAYGFKNFGDFCFGMASTSILYYTDKLKKPKGLEDKDVFTWTPDDAGVISGIRYFQEVQLAFIVQHTLAKLGVGALPLKAQFDIIKNNLEKNKPVMLYLYKGLSLDLSHSVVAIDYFEDPSNPNIKNIVIYDNNFRGMATVLVFDINNNKINYAGYDGALVESPS